MANDYLIGGMADEFESPFEFEPVKLSSGFQPIPLGKVGEESQRAIQESLTPDKVEIPEIKLDVPTQAQISVKRDPLELQTFDVLGLTPDDATSGTDPLAFFKGGEDSDSPVFTSKVGDWKSSITKGLDTKVSPIDSSGEIDEDKLKELEEEGTPFFEPDIDALVDRAQQSVYEYGREGISYLKNLYGTYTPRSAAGINQFGQPMYGSTRLGLGHGISPAATSGASAPVGMAGMGYGSLQSPSAVQQAQQAVAALGPQAPQFANQAMLGQVSGGGYGGLSSSVATGASQLATSGPGVNALGQPMYGSTAAKASSTWATLGNAASVYGIYDGIKNKDYFSAGTSLITLLNPATAVPIAILHAAKFALSNLFGGSRPKPAFGGVDLKASSNKLMTTAGYGYNAYRRETGQAVGASIADYVNQYVKDFGLQFNGNRWKKFIQENPRLERYDSTGETGYSDPSTMIRAILETEGMVTGTPTYNGQPITSQEDYKAKMEDFNKRYQDMAYKNGGLVDPVSVGINTPLSGEFTTVQTKRDTGRPDPNSPLDRNGRHTQNIVAYGERPATLFEMLHKNLTGSYTI